VEAGDRHRVTEGSVIHTFCASLAKNQIEKIKTGKSKNQNSISDLNFKIENENENENRK